MMNRCAYQRNNALGLVAGGGDIMMMRKGLPDSISDTVVCPKPRRLGLLNPSMNDHIRPSRCLVTNYQTEVYDSKAGTELLDMILAKGGYGAERPNTQVPSSPPFFCGSPPSRASNPVIQDARFGSDKPSPLSPAQEASPSPSARKRVNYGHKPAAVRVEGFNCHGSCSISAVA